MSITYPRLVLRAQTYRQQPLPGALEASFDAAGGTLGRAEGNQLVLEDPGKYISRSHAAVTLRDGRFYLADVGANPSIVNDQPLGAGAQVALADGDCIVIGDYVLLATVETSPPMVAEADATMLLPPRAQAASLGPVREPAPGSSPVAPLDASAVEPPLSSLSSLSSPLPPPLPLFEPPAPIEPAPLPPFEPLLTPPAPAPSPLPALPADALSSARILDSHHDGADMHDPLGLNLLGDMAAARNGGAGQPATTRYRGAESDHVSPEWQSFTMPPATPARAATGMQASPTQSAAAHSAVTQPVSSAARDGGIGAPPAIASSAPGPAAAIPADYDLLADLLPAAPAAQSPTPALAPAAPAAQPPAPVTPAAQPTAPAPGALATPAAQTPEPATVAPPAPVARPTVSATSALAASVAQTPEPATVVPPAPAVQPTAPAPAALDASAPQPPAPVTVAPATPGSEQPKPLAAVAPAPVAALPHSAPAVTVAMPAPSQPPASASASDQSILQALLEGLELPNLRTDRAPEALAREIGQMLRAATAGTMEVLMARALTKRESHIDMTMIVPRANNPLKFLPDVDTALTQMLGNQIPGYLPPVDAISSAFDDLKAHELAVIAGMRAALAAVVQRFDPARIEQRLSEPGRIDKLLPGGRKARLWDRLLQSYSELARDADEDLQRLFGEKFSLAYEQQVARLRQQRAGDTNSTLI